MFKCAFSATLLFIFEKMFEDDDFDGILFEIGDVTEVECNSDSDSEKELPYCPCEEPNDQEMINCDGTQCEYEWWHYACAGLTSETIPEGKWICPECRKTKGRVGVLYKHFVELYTVRYVILSSVAQPVPHKVTSCHLNLKFLSNTHLIKRGSGLF